MLAADDITLTIGGETLFLRPSLRAAIRLERKHGLPALAEGIATGNLTVLTAILGECGAPPDVFYGLSLGHALPEAMAAAADLLPLVYGFDREREEGPQKHRSSHTVTRAQHFAELYRIGTGQLGWTPSDTLDATPHEIIEASRGRSEFVISILRARLGIVDDDDPGPSAPAPANLNLRSEDVLKRAEAERDVDGLMALAALGRAA